jgi:hypothetical protein
MVKKTLGALELRPEKKVVFTWFMGERLWLGVPKSIVTAPRQDGVYPGCKLGFSITKESANVEEQFALTLNYELMEEITKKMWLAYLEASPRAAKQLEKIAALVSRKAQKKKKVKKR